MADNTSPPRAAEWLLKRLAATHPLFNCAGDFQEEYIRLRRDRGSFRAGLWYWRQALLSTTITIKSRLSLRAELFGHAILTGLRQIRRHRVFSGINIVGLAVGMTCCLLIFLWVRDEIGYDRFWVNADRICRVNRTTPAPGQSLTGRTPLPLAQALEEETPGIERAARMDISRKFIRIDDRFFSDSELAFVDPAFYEIFQFPLVAGRIPTNPADVSAIVLTESSARRFFGRSDPLGKTVQVGTAGDFLVAGIIKDIPGNSHLDVDAFVAFEARMERLDHILKLGAWKVNFLTTYALLQPAAGLLETTERVNDLYKRRRPQTTSRLSLQPVTRIHFHALERIGSLKYIYIFSTLALFILIIAGINFMNLATARAGIRIREVGVRKVIGAGRGDLIRQFLGESLLFAFLAAILAGLLVQAGLPAFNAISGKTLSPQGVWSGSFWLAFLGIPLLTGLLAGSYPALAFSSLRPSPMLRGGLAAGTGGAGFRRFLVVAQFTISIFLIIGALLIRGQIAYMQSKDLGFDKENLIYFPASGIFASDFGGVRADLLNGPDVLNVTRGNPPVMFDMTTDEVSWEGKPDDLVVDFHMTPVDYDYFKTMKLELAAGRVFSRTSRTDQEDAVIINQEAARAMGLNETDALGKRITREVYESSGKVRRTDRIVGVAKDFHHSSLHERIQPIIYDLDPVNSYMVCARISPGRTTEAVASLREQWERHVPTHPFNYSFMDDTIDQFYRTEKRMGGLFNIFTGMAVLIACLGLFGLAAFTAERRNKEIGIRKTLGAGVWNIVAMLSREFTKWVLIAGLTAAPLACLVMNGWLNRFAYRISISWGVPLSAVALALGAALLTVGYQAVQAGLVDPVKALRDE